MELRKVRFYGAVLAWCLVFALVAGPAPGIVLHDDNEPVETAGANVIGRWEDDASCVVVAPNYVITTCHQGSSSTITIAGVPYNVAEDLPHSTADLRVARITTTAGQNANLTEWAELYITDMGLETDQGTVTIGGYGKSRLATLETGGKAYGYSWTTEDTVGTQLRWGTNEVDSTDSRTSGSWTSQVIIADFDDRTVPQGGPTNYEAAPAEFDSGGGWFFEDGNTWYVAGLTRGAEHALIAQTWFRMSTNPNILDPDIIDAVRISSYSDWIYDQIRHDGDANGDLYVDIIDLTVLAANWYVTDPLSWYDGDFTGDGDVDISDLTALAANWGPILGGPGAEPPAGGDGSVPEPAGLLLVGTCGCALLRRRRLP